MLREDCLYLSSGSLNNFPVRFQDLIDKGSYPTVLEDRFCEKEMLKKIFGPKDIERISKILCSSSGKKFIGEVYRSIELDKFEENVRILLYSSQQRLTS